MYQSYWFVAAGVVVVYDWVLTFGQEIELIWRQRWSLMTVLYLVIRYIGVPYCYLCSAGYANGFADRCRVHYYILRYKRDKCGRSCHVERQILAGVQLFVLGPRLIMSVREYHAKLVANSNAGISMDSIVFQEHVHISTSSTV
ncbi:hypothetical protein BDR04DRAFT_1101665 [Suillus decipiens]|nr:hypothetical protein BDR04DRAFT_1101665 [Suillus decipiens]